MEEAFLHFVWQFQLFDKAQITTQRNEEIVILKQGYLNQNAGPDFLEAKIRIGKVIWHGQVEIHLKSGDWKAHRHSEDAGYDNVILHVVYQHNQEIIRKDGTVIPVLEIGTRIDPDLIKRHRNLIGNIDWIPCQRYLPEMEQLPILSAMEKALVNRMRRKSEEVIGSLKLNNQDWAETSYQVVARSFGFKINDEPMTVLSQILPYRIVRKHRENLLQLEALMFGQAGFLEETSSEPYYALLRREYQYLRHKYELENFRLSRSSWKFLRLRPANFPTLRISQLAALLHRIKEPFGLIQAFSVSEEDYLQVLEVKPSAYWQKHYHFHKVSDKSIAGLGRSSQASIIINAIVPLMVSYGRSIDNHDLVESAFNLLHTIPPENNNILQRWKSIGVKAANAAESQGLLELYKNYCARKQCLSCNIGMSIVCETRKCSV